MRGGSEKQEKRLAERGQEKDQRRRVKPGNRVRERKTDTRARERQGLWGGKSKTRAREWREKG